MFRSTLLLSAAICFLVTNLLIASEKPHVILVMADDQGWGDMAYNGHPLLKTPNFDAAAAQGLRFDRFYAAAPVCSPTRASVLTGRTPNRTGVFKWGYPLRPQEETLAELLKADGYTTGHFGKWHIGSVRKNSPANPSACGFDRWVSAPNYYDNDSPLCDEGTAITQKGESSLLAVDHALEWMRREVDSGEKPIFAVIWFGSPHDPHRAAPEDRRHYEGEKHADFLGEITGMDRAFGRLRDALDDMGIRKNTILWYCSDNGALPKIGSTGGFRGYKSKVYDGGLLVPAFVEWPAKITQPATTSLRCSTYDIFPTILELSGAQATPAHPIDGISLAPLLTGRGLATRSVPLGFWDPKKPGISTPSDRWMKELLAAQAKGQDLDAHPSSLNAAKLPDPPETIASLQGHAAWIEENWKLHRITSEDGPILWELYDLENDPREEQNLANSEPGRVTTMKSALMDWMTAVVASANGQDYAEN